jgi:hypothetical protein
MCGSRVLGGAALGAGWWRPCHIGNVLAGAAAALGSTEKLQKTVTFSHPVE